VADFQPPFYKFSVFSVQCSVGGSVYRTAFLMRCFATPPFSFASANISKFALANYIEAFAIYRVQSTYRPAHSANTPNF